MDNYYLLEFQLTRKINNSFENNIYNFENIGFSVDDPIEKKQLLDELAEWETKGFEVEDKGFVTYEVYFEDSEQGKNHMDTMKNYLLDQDPSIKFESKLVDNSNWEDEWKKSYKSFTIGQNILISPSWEDVEDTDRIVIEIEPKMAFGTGTHETTSMCMEYVEEDDLNGKYVLDIGCGSGILSILAKKLGASHVDACDIDPLAVESTLENSQINGVKVKAFESNLFSKVDGKYDLIFANILAEILVRMIPQTKDYLNPGARLVLSGIINEKEDMVKDCLIENDYQILDIVRKGEWSLIAARRNHV